MLDVTVIFLSAGLLLGAWRREAKSNDDGVDQPLLCVWRYGQIVIGITLVIVGIAYAGWHAKTNPNYLSFGLKLEILRSMLVTLLPAAVFGFLAGLILRIGMQNNANSLLMIGIVFLVLPQLLIEGPRFIKYFQKIKTPWFDIDIKSTESKASSEFYVQDLLDLSRNNPLGKDIYENVKINTVVDDTTDKILSIINSDNKEHPAIKSFINVSKNFKTSDFDKSTQPQIFLCYYKPLVESILDVPPGLSTDHEIRKWLEYTINDLDKIVLSKSSNSTVGLPTELREKFSESINQIKSINKNTKSNSNETENMILSSGECKLNGNNALLFDEKNKNTALIHILSSKLYRRIGSDRLAIQTLNDSAMGQSLAIKDSEMPAAKTSHEARFLKERGELKRTMSLSGWDIDLKRSIAFWTDAVKKLKNYKNYCSSNCEDAEKVVSYLRFEIAQLRNQYVFSSLKNKFTHYENDMRLIFFGDLVRQAKLNYDKLGEIMEVVKYIKSPGAEPCVEVFYADTYAVASMAYARQNGAKDAGDAKTKAIVLLEQALNALDDTCASRKDELEEIIKEHQKIAFNLLQH